MTRRNVCGSRASISATRSASAATAMLIQHAQLVLPGVFVLVLASLALPERTDRTVPCASATYKDCLLLKISCNESPIANSFD